MQTTEQSTTGLSTEKFEKLNPKALKVILPSWEWDGYSPSFSRVIGSCPHTFSYDPKEGVLNLRDSGQSGILVHRGSVQSVEISEVDMSATFISKAGKYTIKQDGLEHVVQDRDGNTIHVRL